jgi:hypothetical protein
VPSFRIQTTIARPAAAVFAKLADPAIAVRIQAGTTRSELLTPPPVRAGSRIRAVRTLEGRTVDGEVEVATFRQDREIEYVGGAQGIRVAYRYSLKDGPAAGTTVATLDVAVEGSGLAALVAGVVTNALQRAESDHLAKLKALVEAT